MPVIIEGTPPPHDPRIKVLKVTPDPGVIEVNLHPAASWDELVHNTTVLYEEARQRRLGTEKFMIDGRHTGTGGGNHIVIGGATPADSPLLRRPDLLRSLLTYWHNHPSLSYLFSGLFIGPTSQAPRVDEARNDSLYELEIAFKQIPERGRRRRHGWWTASSAICSSTPPATRTAPSSASTSSTRPTAAPAASALLEMRNFEMPPHAEMSLAQHLLLRGADRALLAGALSPQPLVRWGTRDARPLDAAALRLAGFRATCSRDLREHGYPLEDDWFAPHLEFRFPRIGDDQPARHRAWKCARPRAVARARRGTRRRAAPCATWIARWSACR